MPRIVVRREVFSRSFRNCQPASLVATGINLLRSGIGALVLSGLFAAGTLQSLSQLASAPVTASVAPTEAVRPTLDRVNEVLAGLNVGRWKAPGEARSVTQRDIDSIQRDIASTLPPLLDQAAAPTASVASYFAVYRNIDALYDVLLRISETATLAGSQSDAAALQGTLSSLEASRRNLGDAILQAANNQEKDLISLRAAAARAVAADAAKPAPPPSKTIVVDGPAPSSKPSPAAKKKKKAAAAATTPANGDPATQPQ